MADFMDLRISKFKRGKRITVRVNGQRLAAYEGETVHALLTANGLYGLRKTRKTGQIRGALCGMGVCYECRVTIDGKPGQQACMTRVKENMEIFTHDDPV
ncbi:(2Fe-2S)-binding protein [Desulfospira joergensenii]|uniref:(2Fe-2S)-binding protein n=1 Tax=Desulfospira joergensenii TaxID=53329 RepID=UPI0003B5EED0|nr:(2Fe-2S)-binding protein [Desulfospira joergensenii]